MPSQRGASVNCRVGIANVTRSASEYYKKHHHNGNRSGVSQGSLCKADVLDDDYLLRSSRQRVRRVCELPPKGDRAKINSKSF